VVTIQHNHEDTDGEKSDSLILTLSRFTHVLDVGRWYWSEPASQMEKLGMRSLNPLTNRKGYENRTANERMQKIVHTEVEVDCSLSRISTTPDTVLGRTSSQPMNGRILISTTEMRERARIYEVHSRTSRPSHDYRHTRHHNLNFFGDHRDR
jgi:hypothetical protein